MYPSGSFTKRTGRDAHATGSAYFFSNFKASEFIQYLSPVGFGPSSNTCPRCDLQRAHRTSVRTSPRERSSFSITFFLLAT